MKKVVLLLSALLVLILSGCSQGYKTPYLELQNNTGYTIAIRMSYVSAPDDWTIPPDKSTEKWLRNGESCVYEIDKTGHYDDIVNLAFFVDWNGTGTAKYEINWHKDTCKNYPDNGYVYSRIYLDNSYNLQTSHEKRELERSVIGTGRLRGIEQVSFVNPEGENVTISE